MALEIFLQIGLLIVIAAVLALILNKLKIPPLLSYIITGIYAGY